MKSRINMRWLVWPAIVAVVALMALPGSSTKAAADEITVNAPAAAGIGSSFTAAIDFTAATGYAGYAAFLTWDDSKVNDNTGAVYTGLGGMTLDAAPVAIDADTDTVTDGYQIGSARPAGTSTALGTAANIGLKCVAQGNALLHLVTLVEDPAFGTTMLGVGGVTIATTLVDDTIACQEQSDLEVTKTHTPNPMVAGSVNKYTITLHNAGPQAARGVVLVDQVPADKVIQGVVQVAPGVYALLPPSMGGGPNGGGVDLTGDTVPDAPCSWYAVFPNPIPPPPVLNNVVLCYIAGASSVQLPAMMPAMPSSMTVSLIINVIPSLASAGKPNVNSATAVLVGAPLTPEPNPTADPNPANNQAIDATVVGPADISIVKAGPASMLQGNAGTYTVTLTNAGVSPASNVSLTDAVPAGFTVGVPTSTQGTCGVVGQLVSCAISDAVTTLASPVTVTIPFTCAAAGTKVNQASVTFADPITKLSNVVTTICLPPFNGMIKDARSDVPGIQDTVNLWLCKAGPDCHIDAWYQGPAIGKGELDVADLLFLREDTDSPNDSDTDPEGLAAYEEQIKYDHKIFDVSVNDAGSDGIDNDQDGGLDEPNESVIEGWRRNINCTMTIMTENWIMFGCVSSGQALGNPAPVGEWLKTIHLVPDSDMFLRIRPTKDNGVVSTILDENCEVADIYASEPWPFTLPGGLTEDCTDLTVTVRMLEGDINLDCEVNVLDEQAIAFRYSSFFGLLLYDKFFDLEPKFADFDIDIKDLQFVFGRDGSMCQAPIPDGQTPSDPIP
jgi:uncharacterized repeat protein (TIGR01451 family)